MHIVGLRSENVKRLKLVDLKVSGNLIKITGANGQGKTSLLDSICLALGGDAAVKLTKTKQPVRSGQVKAETSVDIGEYVVTRTWKPDGTSTLKVVTQDGVKVTNPQTVLNGFVGTISFDPQEFINMDEGKQTKTLQQIVGFNPEQLDRDRKILFDDRTAVNRKVKEVQAQINAMAVPGEDVPDEPLKMEDALEAMNAGMEAMRTHNAKEVKLYGMRDDVAKIERDIKRLEVELAEKKEHLAHMVTEGKALVAEVEAEKPNLPNIDQLQANLKKVSTINDAVRLKKDYNRLIADLANVTSESESLTGKIAAIDKTKEDAMKNASFPVEGLSFGDDGVYFNDVPLNQASHAEKIRIGMAMGMKLNPKLRIILIRDGEKFDSNAWKVVEQMAIENDFQVWCEMVDETGKIGVYLEDGEVVEPEVTNNWANDALTDGIKRSKEETAATEMVDVDYEVVDDPNQTKLF